MHKENYNYKEGKRVLNSIYSQHTGSFFQKTYFVLTVLIFYICKRLGLPKINIIPKAKLNLEGTILETRSKTIDFWVLLNVFEPDVTYFFTKLEKSTLVDIGAHIGRFSSLVASRGWDVYSFEPMKSTFSILEKNVMSNKNDNEIISLNNIGISNKTEVKNIFFEKHKTGEASLEKKSQDDASEQVKLGKLTDYVPPMVSTKTTVLKIDVEGVEKEVLDGALIFIEQNKPIIIAELWHDNKSYFREKLQPLGYKNLHVFWFIEEVHHNERLLMDNLYNKYKTRYEYA